MTADSLPTGVPPASPPLVSAPDRQALARRFRPAWWVLGLAGLAVLLPALLLQAPPGAAPPPAAAVPTRSATAPPEAVSLPDVAGRFGLALLALYAAGWGLVKLRRRGWSLGLATRERPAPPARLRLAESLPLGTQQGTLHLIEVDGATVLLASALDQVSLLLTLAPDHTTSFPPVPAERPDFAPEPMRVPELWPVASPAPPLRPERGPSRPARHEADWLKERSRLLSALRTDPTGARTDDVRLRNPAPE